MLFFVGAPFRGSFPLYMQDGYEWLTSRKIFPDPNSACARQNARSASLFAFLVLLSEMR
jgi:hypothetical protein